MGDIRKKALRDHMRSIILGESIDDVADVAGDMLMATLPNMSQDSPAANQVRLARKIIDSIVADIKEGRHLTPNER